MSTGPKKKPSQTTDRKDIEVQTEPDIAYPPILLPELENADIVHSGIRPAIVSHQTDVHSELRSRVTSPSNSNSDVTAANTNVVGVGHNEHSHFVNPLPTQLPPGYKPSLPVIDYHTASTSLA